MTILKENRKKKTENIDSKIKKNSMRKMNERVTKSEKTIIQKERINETELYKGIPEGEGSICIRKEKYEKDEKNEKDNSCSHVDLNRRKMKIDEETSPNVINYDGNSLFNMKNIKHGRKKISRYHAILFSNKEKKSFRLQENEKIQNFQKGEFNTQNMCNYICMPEYVTSKIKNSLITRKEKKNVHFLLKCTKVKLRKGIKLLKKHNFSCTLVIVKKKKILFVRNKRKNYNAWKNRLWKRVLKSVLCDMYNIDYSSNVLKIKQIIKKTKDKDKDNDNDKEKGNKQQKQQQKQN